MASYQLPQVRTAAAPAPTPTLMSVGVQPAIAAAPPTPSGPVHIAALPLEVDLDLYAGDDFYLDIAVFNPDGSPMDVSSAAPMSMIRLTVEDTHILATLIITVDPDVTGLLHMSIPSVYSTTLPPKCVYDVQLSIPVIVTLIAGTITMHPQVTR
jgi:hypothetical protein